jgi:hypothetical protein
MAKQMNRTCHFNTEPTKTEAFCSGYPTWKHSWYCVNWLDEDPKNNTQQCQHHFLPIGFVLFLVLETLPPRGFSVDSDLNLSPPYWLESWLNVLRRYYKSTSTGANPARGAFTAYVRPSRTPQCVCGAMHWINSLRCDTIPEANSCNQHFSTQGGHPSKYWLSRCCCTSVLKNQNRGNRCFNIVKPLALEFGLLRMVRQPSADTHEIWVARHKVTRPQTILKFRPPSSLDYRTRHGSQWMFRRHVYMLQTLEDLFKMI